MNKIAYIQKINILCKQIVQPYSKMNFANNNFTLIETPTPVKVYQNFPVSMNEVAKGQENINFTNFGFASEKKNLNKESKQQSKQGTYQAISPCRLFMSDAFLISPVRDYKIANPAMTPLKNDSVLSSPTFKFDYRMDTPFEKYDIGSSRKLFAQGEENSIIKGKKINFNIEEEENLINTSTNNKSASNLITSMQGKICCTCTKTGCLKKYCACYANGKLCEGCDCKNCYNTKDNENNILLNNNQSDSDSHISNENNNSNINHVHGVLICNCTKSNCTKKYCECYKQGKECGPLCRCVNCVNKEGKQNLILQQTNRKENTNSNVIKAYRQNFCIGSGAIGIEINKKGMHIKLRNVKCDDNEEIQKTPKMTNKKRARPKTESTKMKTPSEKKSRKSCMNKNSKIKTKKLLL